MQFKATGTASRPGERPQMKAPPPDTKVDRRTRKSIAGRFYQLMSGDAAIGPYLKDKIHKTDDDRCWWCGGGKQQTCHHLFTECRAWPPQVRRLWKDIGKACRWKHPRAPSVKWLWKKKATEAVLVFLRDTRVGCISTGREPPEKKRGGEGGGHRGKGGQAKARPGMWFLSVSLVLEQTRGWAIYFLCYFLCLLSNFLCLAVNGFRR